MRVWLLLLLGVTLPLSVFSCNRYYQCCFSSYTGRITSYNYASGWNYHSGRYCSTSITVARNQRIRIYFPYFQTESCCDYLQLTSGSQTSTFRGSRSGTSYVTTTNRVTLYFGSNSRTQYRGFDLRWTAVGMCYSPSPCRNGGSCTQTSSSPYYRCRCAQGWSGSTCTTRNGCSPGNPCSNSGTCTRLSASPYYRCTCARGWDGSTCATRNGCDPSPCRNSGRCTRLSSNPYYRCTCTGEWWSGSTCATGICTLGYCENNSTCSRTTSRPYYGCNCSSWYSDYNCTTEICELGYCANNATCLRSNSTPYYGCNCRPGYIGYNCTIDLCTPNPCRNGGTCMGTAGSAYCRCTFRYFGRNCGMDAIGIAAGCIIILLLLLLLGYILYRIKRKKVSPLREMFQRTFSRRGKENKSVEKKVIQGENESSNQEKVETPNTSDSKTPVAADSIPTIEEKFNFKFSVVSRLRQMRSSISGSFSNSS